MLTEHFSHSGEATYFYQNGNAGSCGQYHSDSDYIVAVSPAGYTVSNHCGKQVTITNTETGITATATAQILATVTTTSLVPRRTSI
jgi:hypothetical protein